jgi:hypothetical protein
VRRRNLHEPCEWKYVSVEHVSLYISYKISLECFHSSSQGLLTLYGSQGCLRQHGGADDFYTSFQIDSSPRPINKQIKIFSGQSIWLDASHRSLVSGPSHNGERGNRGEREYPHRPRMQLSCLNPAWHANYVVQHCHASSQSVRRWKKSAMWWWGVLLLLVPRYTFTILEE